MKPSADLIPIASGLPAPPAGSSVRPMLPKSAELSAVRCRDVDLDEQMDPMAVSESTADDTQSFAATLLQLAVIAVASAAIWWLLPRGVTARPPLELPEPLQAETAAISPARRDAETAAIGVLKRAAPTEALAAFRPLVDAPEEASVNLWRYYLQTLVDLDERAELRRRAAEFLSRHPDRLEAAHFLAEAIRRDDPGRNREDRTSSRTSSWTGVWDSLARPRASAASLAEIDRCQDTIDDALGLLQQHDGDWSMAGRTAWADLLHLDRARLHAHAWKCGGHDFADPHREQALEAIRKMSSTATADALSLRLAIYRTCLAEWPTRLPFASKKQLVNGFDWTKDDLQRAIDVDRAALDQLPPLGRR